MAHLDLLTQLCFMELLDSGVSKQAMLAMAFSRDERQCFADSSKVFLHFICLQCQYIESRPEVTLSAKCLVAEMASKVYLRQKASLDSSNRQSSLHYTQGKETKVIFHLCR